MSKQIKTNEIKHQKNENCKPSPGFLQSLMRLDELKGIVDHAILEKVKDFIPKLYRQPEIFPLQDGGLQFEYDRDDGAYLEFEFHADNKVKMFFADFDGCEQNKELNCNIDEINNAIGSFFWK